MDAQATPRRTRWKPQPFRDKNGKVRVINEKTITPSGLAILKRAARYRYTPTSVFMAHLGVAPRYVHELLAQLYSPPSNLIKRVSRRLYPDAMNLDAIYHITPDGEKVLRNRDIYVPTLKIGDEKLLAHSLMISHTLQSIELDARITFWDELKISGLIKQNAPDEIPVSVRAVLDGELHMANFDYTNDSGGIFAVTDGADTKYLSLEVEHRNRVWCSNLKQASFMKKCLAIRHIMDEKLYQKHWGIPHLMHLVVCPNLPHLNKMRQEVLDQTKGKGLPYILFRVVPSIMQEETTLKPDPTMYTGLWERAGFPPVSLKDI